MEGARHQQQRRLLPLTTAGKEPFPDYGWAYYNYLVSQFDALEPIDPEKQEIANRFAGWVAAIEARQPPELKWNDLATLETLLLKLEPDEEVKRKSWIVRERYRRIVSAEEYAAYVASAPPNLGENVSMPQLRADLEGLLAELHLNYDLRTQHERLRGWLTTRTAYILAGLFVLVLLLMGLDNRRLGTTETTQDRPTRVGQNQSFAPSIGVAYAAPTPPRPPRPARQIPGPQVGGGTVAGGSTANPPARAQGSSPAPLKPPSSLEMQNPRPTVVLLQWTSNSPDASGFAVERKDGAEDFRRIGTVPQNVTAFTDSGLNLGQVYSYRVRAIRANGDLSAPSEPRFHVPEPPQRPQILSLFAIVCVMGATGGFVSVHRRMQQAPMTGDLLNRVVELEHGRHTIMLGPVYGLVFALILYLLFASGYFKGELFPAIFPSGYEPLPGGRGYLPADGSTDFQNFMAYTYPISPIDVAKLLIWSFIAGFAERLVPDTLDRLTARAEGRAETAGRGLIFTPPAPRPPNAVNGDQGNAEKAQRNQIQTDVVPGVAPGTAQAPDPSLPAPLHSIVPAEGSAGSPTLQIVIRFTDPIRSADFALVPDEEDPVELQQALSPDGLVLTLTPTASLSPGRHELSLATVYFPNGTEEPLDVRRTFNVV